MERNPNLTSWEQMMVDYGFFHQQKFNILMHLIFVPIIVMSVMVPFALVEFAYFEVGGIVLPLNLAAIVTIGLAAFYISLDKTLGVISIPILIILLFGATEIATFGTRTALIWAAIGFVGGFAFQFLGHAVEGKKPALTAYNPAVAMLSSPLFVVAEYVKPFGVHKELWKKADNEIQRLEVLEKGNLAA